MLNRFIHTVVQFACIAFGITGCFVTLFRWAVQGDPEKTLSALGVTLLAFAIGVALSVWRPNDF